MGQRLCREPFGAGLDAARRGEVAELHQQDRQAAERGRDQS
jgi:hypothetical protein